MTAPTWSTYGARLVLGLIMDNPGPQQAGLAVGVVGDTASGVEDHRRAVRIRIGGPSRDRGIIWAAVAGEGDPGIRDPGRQLTGARGGGGRVGDLGVAEDEGQLQRVVWLHAAALGRAPPVERIHVDGGAGTRCVALGQQHRALAILPLLFLPGRA